MKYAASPHRGAIAWMAYNPIAANLLMLLLMLAGIAAALQLPKEVFPSFPTETVRVSVSYPGSAPEEIEEGILIKIEEAIQDIKGIKRIRSTANENTGTVEIEFNAGENMEAALNNVKNRVDSISAFPLGAEPPIVENLLTRNRVITLNISGSINEKALTQLANQVREELLEQPQLTQVSITGNRNYEISIEVSSDTLRRYQLSFDQLVNAIRQHSRDLPGGIVRTTSQTITLRSQGQARNANDYAAIPIITRNDGTRVSLGDLAKIRDHFAERPVLNRFNGRPAITLTVDQIGNENALAISEYVKSYVTEKRKTLPPGVFIDTAFDFTKVLKGRLYLLLKSAAQGALLVMITLALFLNIKLAFWVMMGVPFCFLAALATMQPLGLSINVISLFGFILVLGIIVDDAIVVAESAYHTLELERKGIDSIIKGAQRVSVATVFGVLTTIIAFLPALFITEGIGRFFGVMGSIVILCLLFSMVESKFILPAHLASINLDKRVNRRWTQAIERLQNAVQKGLQYTISQYYHPVLRRAVDCRYLTLTAFISFAVISYTLLPSGLVRFVFFPNVPSDYIRIHLITPEGTSHQKTVEYATSIEAAATAINQRFREAEGVETDIIQYLSTTTTSDTSALINAELLPSTERRTRSTTIAQWWREAIGTLPGIESIRFDASAGPGDSPIDIELSSDHLQSLRQASQDIKTRLKEYQGVFDIEDNLNDGGPEMDIQLTSQGRALGLGQAELARQIRQAFFGAEIQRLQRQRDEIRVYLRLPESERDNLDSLETLWIRLPDGSDVPFSVVATARATTGIGSLNRIDRHRVVNITANVDKARVEPGAITTALTAELAPLLKREYPQVSLHFAGEAEDQAENTTVLKLGVLFILVAIYAALAIPLKSYWQPIVIISIVPFGFVGALWGHYLLGQDLSILSLIGVVALIGIVINDSLVLVDYMNQQIDSGETGLNAIIQAGEKRFRAVLLTSITTFMGLLPIQLETSIQAQFLKPMAVSVSFGVLFATVVTLLLVPALMTIAEDVKQVRSKA